MNISWQALCLAAVRGGAMGQAISPSRWQAALS